MNNFQLNPNVKKKWIASFKSILVVSLNVTKVQLFYKTFYKRHISNVVLPNLFCSSCQDSSIGSTLDWYNGGRGFESRKGRELLILNKKELLIWIWINCSKIKQKYKHDEYPQVRKRQV